jgi:Xaa-Pro aminopeptidase
MPAPQAEQLEEYAERRQRLAALIGADSVLVLPGACESVRNRDVHYRFRQNSDFLYLTGFAEPDSIAVLAPGRDDGAFILFVRERNPERETWDGRRAGPEGAVADYGADQAFTVQEFSAWLPRLLAGREKIHYTLGERPSLDAELAACVRQLREVSRRGAAAPTEFVALETTLHEMRLCKTRAEIALLRKACDVSARAHVRAMRATRPGRYEYQIAAEIHHEFELEGMEPGYGSIVGGGANGCILHYQENDATLRDGDLLLVDAGGELRGYTADITRTFPVNGRFSGAQRAVYDIVLAANKAAIQELRVGLDSSRPHEVAVRVLTEGMVELGLLQGEVSELIRSERYKRFYMHGTGHWLGMDVHDVGRYKLEGKSRPFVEGMVMTVEPGIYIPPGSENVDARFHGIGVRIEDDVLVSAAGPKVLTASAPKEREDIEALMRA